MKKPDESHDGEARPDEPAENRYLVERKCEWCGAVVPAFRIYCPGGKCAERARQALLAEERVEVGDDLREDLAGEIRKISRGPGGE